MKQCMHGLAAQGLTWLLVVALVSSGCSLAAAPDPVPGLPEFHVTLPMRTP